MSDEEVMDHFGSVQRYIKEKEATVAKLKRYYAFKCEHGFWPHEIKSMVLKPQGRKKDGWMFYHTEVTLKTGEIKYLKVNVPAILEPDKWVPKR